MLISRCTRDLVVGEFIPQGSNDSHYCYGRRSLVLHLKHSRLRICKLGDRDFPSKSRPAYQDRPVEDHLRSPDLPDQTVSSIQYALLVVAEHAHEHEQRPLLYSARILIIAITGGLVVRLQLSLWRPMHNPFVIVREFL